MEMLEQQYITISLNLIHNCTPARAGDPSQTYNHRIVAITYYSKS